MKRRRFPSHSFIMVEMVMALALLLILSGAFYGVWRTIRIMDQTFTVERQALMVLDNTSERLEAKPHYSAADVKRIFQDEFARSGIPPQLKIRPQILDSPNRIILALIRPDGKSLIEVTIHAQK